MNRIVSEGIFLAHLLLVLVILFGWIVPSWFWVYGAALQLTALSWIIFGRCVLVDIEVYFRTEEDSAEHPKQDSFIAYFLSRWFGEKAPTDRFITIWGGVFLAISISVWYAKLFGWL